MMTLVDISTFKLLNVNIAIKKSLAFCQGLTHFASLNIKAFWDDTAMKLRLHTVT